ncbi:hypothetical protein AAFF_G00031270 [Aldrovandia affinis]|uniref:Phospholipase A2 n=1 Tax=Aldrovandia affinis TaxID=143900 RepID=A0AAD7S6F5_9TELE|nr:hypothetical protein AAFF_G00031270 [Aldrovandia affinis]
MTAVRTGLLLAIGLATVLAGPTSRALWQFREMMVCTMPDSWPLLDFTDYGCYCGKGGSGSPVDDLDRCCYVHDKCYEESMQMEECWPILDNPYTEMYSYKCNEATKTVTCSGENTSCEKFICECDRQAAICFAGATYNEENEHLPSRFCK